MYDFNGIEPVCPFDVSQYYASADYNTATGRIDVKKLLSEVDALYEVNRLEEAEALLEDSFRKADQLSDHEGKLGILNELLGCYRKTHKKEAAFWAVNESQRLLTALGMDNTVTSGTVRLNAATTLREFGEAEKALELYVASARVFSNHLDPNDYRFATLYNNYAACLETCGDVESAEKYYLKAIAVLKRLPECKIEEAVTYVNLACLYGELDPEDSRIEKYLFFAKDIFDDEHVKRDGYYAFNVLKCVSAYDHYGFFRDAAELKKRAEKIYGLL